MKIRLFSPISAHTPKKVKAKAKSSELDLKIVEHKMGRREWAVVGAFALAAIGVLGTAVHRNREMNDPKFIETLTGTFKQTPEQVLKAKCAIFYKGKSKEAIIDSLRNAKIHK